MIIVYIMTHIIQTYLSYKVIVTGGSILFGAEQILEGFTSLHSQTLSYEDTKRPIRAPMRRTKGKNTHRASELELDDLHGITKGEIDYLRDYMNTAKEAQNIDRATFLKEVYLTETMSSKTSDSKETESSIDIAHEEQREFVISFMPKSRR